MKEEPSAFFTYVVTYHIFQEVHMVKGHAFFLLWPVAVASFHVEAWRVIFLQAVADTTRKGLCMVCSPYNGVDNARLWHG